MFYKIIHPKYSKHSKEYCTFAVLGSIGNVHTKKLIKEAFNNYGDIILPFFDPPPLRGQFLYPERGLKQTFFELLPPPLVHVVIECPPTIKKSLDAPCLPQHITPHQKKHLDDSVTLRIALW